MPVLGEEVEEVRSYLVDAAHEHIALARIFQRFLEQAVESANGNHRAGLAHTRPRPLVRTVNRVSRIRLRACRAQGVFARATAQKSGRDGQAQSWRPPSRPRTRVFPTNSLADGQGPFRGDA